MNRSTSEPTSRWDAFKRLLFAQLGVNEVLFLLGLGSFFYGNARLWSVEWAFLVCGFVLMSIAVVGVIFAHQKGN